MIQSFRYAALLHLLWLLALYLAAVRHTRRRRRRKRAAFTGRSEVASWRNAVQCGLAVSGAALLTLAAARPLRVLPDRPPSRIGHEIVLAVDVSRSMLARDILPDRLTRVKIEAGELLKELEGHRIGLVAFRAGASLVCPLTHDRAFVQRMLDGLHPDFAAPGETDIGAGLRLAVETLPESDGHHQAIILLSDGEDLAGEVFAAAREAGERGIRVLAVGIGDPGGAPVPAPDGDGVMTWEGQPVLSRMEGETLRRVARLTGGVSAEILPAYASAFNLRRIYGLRMRPLLRAADLPSVSASRPESEAYAVFALPAALALLAALCLSRGRFGQAGFRSLASLSTAVLLSAAAGSGCGRPGSAAARRAASLYGQGRFGEAAEAYLETAAAATDEDTAFHARMNAGAALLRGGRFERAFDLFDALLQETPAQAAHLDRLATACIDLAAHAPAEGPHALRRETALLAAAHIDFELLRRDARHPNAGARLRHALQRLPDAARSAERARILDASADADLFDMLDRLYRSHRRWLARVRDARQLEPPEQIRALEAAAHALRTHSHRYTAWSLRVRQASPDESPPHADIALLPPEAGAPPAARFDTAVRQLRNADFQALATLEELDAQLLQAWTRLATPGDLAAEALFRQTNGMRHVMTAAWDAAAWQDASRTHASVTHCLDALLRRMEEDADRLPALVQMLRPPDPHPLPEADRRQAARLASRVRERLAAASAGPDVSRAVFRDGQEEVARRLERLYALFEKPSFDTPPTDEVAPHPAHADPDPSADVSRTDAPPELPVPGPPREAADVEGLPFPEDLDAETADRILKAIVERERDYAERLRQRRQFPTAARGRDW